MKKLMSALTLGVALILASAAGSAAQELADMGAEFKQAARMLDVEVEEYGKARERERQDLAELRRVNAEFDKTIADPRASAADLGRLDRQIESARELAIASSRACADARRRMFDQMRVVADLLRDFEDEGVTVAPAAGDIQGSWRLQSSNGVSGLLVLDPSGSLVSGSYRLSNGRRGSLRGTFAGDVLELQLVDNALGLIGTIEGRLDASGDLAGTWQRMDLTSGQGDTAGRWSATRIGNEDVLDR